MGRWAGRCDSRRVGWSTTCSTEPTDGAPLFQEPGDYQAFLRVLAGAQHEHPLRLLAYGVLPNHWHLVLWPERDRQLSRFVGWLTLTHTQRWHAYRGSVGSGHVYQGRFQSFPVAADDHLWTVCR